MEKAHGDPAFEGRLIYERLSKGKRQKAAEGGYVGGWLPYGYRNDGRITVVPEEAAVVRHIFRWHAEGRSLRWIAARLNGQGVRTRKSGVLRPSTLYGMLANRFYADRNAIVPIALFDVCQKT